MTPSLITTLLILFSFASTVFTAPIPISASTLALRDHGHQLASVDRPLDFAFSPGEFPRIPRGHRVPMSVSFNDSVGVALKHEAPVVSLGRRVLASLGVKGPHSVTIIGPNNFTTGPSGSTLPTTSIPRHFPESKDSHAANISVTVPSMAWSPVSGKCNKDNIHWWPFGKCVDKPRSHPPHSKPIMLASTPTTVSGDSPKSNPMLGPFPLAPVSTAVDDIGPEFNPLLEPFPLPPTSEPVGNGGPEYNPMLEPFPLPPSRVIPPANFTTGPIKPRTIGGPLHCDGCILVPTRTNSSSPPSETEYPISILPERHGLFSALGSAFFKGVLTGNADGSAGLSEDKLVSEITKTDKEKEEEEKKREEEKKKNAKEEETDVKEEEQEEQEEQENWKEAEQKKKEAEHEKEEAKARESMKYTPKMEKEDERRLAEERASHHW